MWIVQLALRRPHTFIVMALLILILGPLAILRTPVDIFPNIDIPVAAAIWNYTGLSADELAARITGTFERASTTTVDNIEHIESQSLNGVSVTKYFFHPGADIDRSIAQMTASGQSYLRLMPPGTLPPQILAYNASSVPVIQLALSSRSLTEQQLYDSGQVFIRTQLAAVHGASVPFPYGGKQREVEIDLNQAAMQQYGMSPADVQAAIAAQNVMVPAGTEKVGEFEYNVKLNGSTETMDELNALPMKAVNGSTIFLRDVGHALDGAPPQTNIVRVNGERAALMTIQKTGDASTLDIVNAIKDKLPLIREAAPAGLDIRALGDQSIFVKAAVTSVVREGIIAAALTGLMILLFLGSWRSTLIIAISIPLSVLVSIVALSALGQTINIMTLGGLALAVGILVDDATVAIENINAHLERGEEVEAAILNGAAEIATPALVSTLCICVVFLPMFFLTGVPRFLFVPLAEAICFAMLASYVLSRTLVPTLAMYWLKAHSAENASGPMAHFQAQFENRFEQIRSAYGRALTGIMARRKLFLAWAFGLTFASLLLIPWLGRDFFPAVNAGQIKLHLRAHAGLRIEETARLCDQVDNLIRHVIPREELGDIIDNAGMPFSGVNLTYSNSAPIGTSDADIYVTLKDGHKPTQAYIQTLRSQLRDRFPGVSFAFLPADIVGQILNFGSPSPIDVQIAGTNATANQAVMQDLLKRMQHVPGLVDARIQQDFNAPEFRINVDRSRAQDVGLTQRDVANDVLISLSGSQQTQPSYWMDRKSNSNYAVVTQTPQPQMTTLDALRNIPITTTSGTQKLVLGGLGNITRGTGPAVVSHYNVLPTIDIYAAADGRDLGGVANDVGKLVAAAKKHLPKGSTITLRGQVVTMSESFQGLFLGLAFAVVLVYLLIVVNFLSWLDPLIIISALPAALAGIVWMLFLTGTPLSVPALTGAIMSVGVATANSILVVSFARDRILKTGCDAVTAAFEAGLGRFRPVLMTALAMIIGMLPMALGLGEGGEQNAPLGRAVIGGLTVATCATLLLVPVIFSLVGGAKRRLAHA